MLKSLSKTILAVCVSVPVVFPLLSSCQKTEGSTSIVKRQLEGVKSVHLSVFLDQDIPNQEAIDKQLTELAKKVLTGTGLSVTDKPEECDVYFSIDVLLFPIKNIGWTDYALVEVSTELSEPVRLVRNPSLKNAQCDRYGATWKKNWVELKKWPAVESFIVKEVLEQLDSFCSDLKRANRMTTK